jgi:hypothetical protein
MRGVVAREEGADGGCGSFRQHVLRTSGVGVWRPPLGCTAYSPISQLVHVASQALPDQFGADKSLGDRRSLRSGCWPCRRQLVLPAGPTIGYPAQPGASAAPIRAQHMHMQRDKTRCARAARIASRLGPHANGAVGGE